MNIELEEAQADKVTRDRLMQLLFKWKFELERLRALGGDSDFEYENALDDRITGCEILLAYYAGIKGA